MPTSGDIKKGSPQKESDAAACKKNAGFFGGLCVTGVTKVNITLDSFHYFQAVLTFYGLPKQTSITLVSCMSGMYFDAKKSNSDT